VSVGIVIAVVVARRGEAVGDVMLSIGEEVCGSVKVCGAGAVGLYVFRGGGVPVE